MHETHRHRLDRQSHIVKRMRQSQLARRPSQHTKPFHRIWRTRRHQASVHIPAASAIIGTDSR